MVCVITESNSFLVLCILGTEEERCVYAYMQYNYYKYQKIPTTLVTTNLCFLHGLTYCCFTFPGVASCIHIIRILGYTYTCICVYTVECITQLLNLFQNKRSYPCLVVNVGYKTVPLWFYKAFGYSLYWKQESSCYCWFHKKIGYRLN